MSEQSQRNSGRRRVLAVAVALVAVVGPMAGVGVVASAPATDDTRSIAYGETVSGAVDSVDPIRSNPTENSHSGDWYYEPVSFQGSEGDVIDVRLFGPTDTSLVLVGPDGQRVASNEDGGTGNNSQILHRLDDDGTYTIQVTSHFPEDSYQYLLSLDRIDTSEELSLSAGGTVVSTIDATDPEQSRFEGHYERVSLDATVGQTVELHLSSTFDSALYLIAPNNRVVAQDVAPYSGRDATVRYTFEQDRPHTVIAASGDDMEGFVYELTATDVTNETNESSTERSSGSSDGGDSHHAGTGHSENAQRSPSIRLLNASLNRTTATLGSSVEYTATVANYGDRAGTFDRPVVVDGVEVARLTGQIEPYRLRTLTATVAPNRTGQFRVTLDNESAESLSVVPPVAPAGNTVAISNDTHVGVKQNATAGERIEFVFDMPGTAVTLQSASVVPADDGTMWLEAVRTSNLSAGSPPADGVGTTHSYVLRPTLRANGTTVEPPIDDGTVTVAVDRDALGDASEASVTLYRYDEAAGTWSPLSTTRVESTDDSVLYRAQTTQFSTVAVGTVTPVNATADLSTSTITAGESVTVTTTLRNVGSAAVERTVPITVDGEQVAERTVSIPAGGERTVSAAISPPAGTHEIGAGGVSAGTVTVDAAATTTGTDETTAGGSGPGFGVLAALVAVTAALLLAAERRD